jgi:hypothetical protein
MQVTCPVGCALVFPEFSSICASHISDSKGEQAVVDYATFSDNCLAQDGLALVEYALELKSLGCQIDLVTGRRQMQGMLSQFLDSSDNHCVWEEIDDLANAVDAVCCVDNACREEVDAFLPPQQCSLTCLISMHEFIGQCGRVLSDILGSTGRYSIIEGFEEKCLNEVDTSSFMLAIDEAVCPDENGNFPSGTPAPAPTPGPGISILPTHPAINADVVKIETDGTVLQSAVVIPGEAKVFTFHAIAGDTYQLDTDLETLPDSVMELIDIDATTELVENDDDPRVSDLYDSYIEWTCPLTGDYFVNIHEYGMDTGTFSLAVTAASSGVFGGGEAGGDPCVGGATMTEDNAQISFSPDGNYEDNARCQWIIECPNHMHPMLEFEEFETEADYDFVVVYDGRTSSSTLLSDGDLSGDLSDLTTLEYSGTQDSLMVEFESDESLSDGGFEAMYRCTK